MSAPAHESEDTSGAAARPAEQATAAAAQAPPDAAQASRLQFHVALPIPHSPSVPELTPPGPAERTNWLSAPASARTSFTRVDQTRAGTPVPEEDGSEGGSPSDAGAAPVAEEPEPVHAAVPQASVTFLLVSGRRRNMLFEPATTIGRVKELVWNTWPSDWQDERPPAPAYLRILFLGRVLQDDDTLTGLSIPTFTPPEPATPTIMHLSIRPIAPTDDGAGLKKKRSRRGTNPTDPESGEAAESGCCCIIC